MYKLISTYSIARREIWRLLKLACDIVATWHEKHEYEIYVTSQKIVTRTTYLTLVQMYMVSCYMSTVVIVYLAWLTLFWFSKLQKIPLVFKINFGRFTMGKAIVINQALTVLRCPLWLPLTQWIPCTYHITNFAMRHLTLFNCVAIQFVLSKCV